MEPSVTYYEMVIRNNTMEPERVMMLRILILFFLLGGVGLANSAEPAVADSETAQAEEIIVTAERPQTAASDQSIRDEDLKYFPHQTASDLMRIVPGLHITQHTGGAKAHQIFLRGFDAEHGQDVLATIDGIPINEISHVHGQGYLDLHFLIPEMIERIRILKGPYDGRFGNFATAGVVRFETFERLPYQAGVTTEGGMFGQASGLAALSLGDRSQSLALAIQSNQTDGFSDPGRLTAFRAFSRAHFQTAGGARVDALYAGYRARSQAADCLPLSWIEQNRISRFGALDDSNRVDVDRHLVGLTLRKPQGDGKFLLRGYYNFKDTRILSNYTFFYFNPEQGDQLEQSDLRHYGGLDSSYSFVSSLGEDMLLSSEWGIAYRTDAISQTQANTVAGERFNVMNHYRIGEHSLGMYLHEQLFVNERWMFTGGLRYDLDLSFARGTQDVRELDIYTNRVVIRDDLPRDQSAVAHAISPKLSVAYSLAANWQLFGNLGRGFVTRPARDQVNQTHAMAPAVHAAELGTRWSSEEGQFSVGGALWWMQKDAEWVFDSEFGGTILRGQSHRAGLELELRLRPCSWAWLAADLFVVEGLMQADAGWEPIPNAPSLLFTQVAGVRHDSGFHAALRGRYLGKRQHDLGLESKASYVVDLVLGYASDHFELSVTVDNLFDTEWYDSVFAFPSRPDPNGSVDEGLQVTPGTPFALRASLSMRI